jgi:hypothetical protein
MYLHCMLLARLLCLQTEKRTKIKRMCNTSCKTACASSKPEWKANIFPFPNFLTRCLSRLARRSHRGHIDNRPCRCIPRRWNCALEDIFQLKLCSRIMKAPEPGWSGPVSSERRAVFVTVLTRAEVLVSSAATKRIVKWQRRKASCCRMLSLASFSPDVICILQQVVSTV